MPVAIALWLLVFSGLATAQCAADRIDETVVVAQVFDGDTVRLEDGRRLRFIGIDTPEIDHRGGQSEPYSRAAQRRVQALLADGGRLSLRYDREREDHYGRALAHPYLVDGRSLNALLLEEGLARALVVPPNLWQQDCYRAVMAGARQARAGMWRLAGHRLTPASGLDKVGKGYRWISGRIEGFERTTNSHWLILNGGVRLRIAREDLAYFESLEVEKLPGSLVQADGWLQGKPGNWRMRLRHPVQLQIMP